VLRVFGAANLPQAQVATPWPSEPGRPADVVDSDDPATMAPDVYERRRILAGVPVCGVDIGPDTIPAEVGAWAIEAAVSFTKGCYTGQELVARIDSRGGNVPRPLRVLRSVDGAPLTAGADVLGPDGASAGTATSAAGDVALGPLARKIEIGARVEVGGAVATVVR
jgi:folate-binding protein YgfZ